MNDATTSQSVSNALALSLFAVGVLPEASRNYVVNEYEVVMIEGPQVGPTGNLEFWLSLTRSGEDATPEDNHCEVRNPPVADSTDDEVEALLSDLVVMFIEHWQRLGWC